MAIRPPLERGENTTLLKRLEEEIPAKWLHDFERIFAEGRVDVAAAGSPELSGGRSRHEQNRAVHS